MNRKFLEYIYQSSKQILFSIVILILVISLGESLISTIPPNVPDNVSKKTVYVSADQKGNFNCNGRNDQVEINKALAYVAENPQFTTVHLKGPSTYVISDSVFIGNDTVLQGDSTAVIKLKDKASWPSGKPLITQMDKVGNHNITIAGFEIDGNHDKNTDRHRGEGYYNMIRLTNSRNIQVHDMYMHDGHGDGLRVENSSNIRFFNNKVYKLGHDGFYAIGCQYIKAWNNRITCRTNSGIRLWDSNHAKFHDNVIDSFYNWSAGGPGIQIDKSKEIVNDVEVYDNTIHDTYGPGIWLIGYCRSYSREEAQNIHIHDNILYNTGINPNVDWVGGIITSGFYDTLIENNVFRGVHHAAIIHMYPTGTDYPVDLSPKGKGYTTIVRNNTIENTQKRTKDPDGTGYAVINYLPETHTFILENNCLYNNVGGKYINANSTTDIYTNPSLINQRNYDKLLTSRIQRSHIMIAVVQKIRTGINWFEKIWSIPGNTINQSIRKPVYVLDKNYSSSKISY